MDDFRSDSAYFTRRASEETEAAERATNPRARQLHIELAARYFEAARARQSQSVDELEKAPVAAAPASPAELRILH